MMFFKDKKCDLKEDIKEAERLLEVEAEKFEINRAQFHKLAGISGREVLGEYITEIYRQRSKKHE